MPKFLDVTDAAAARARLGAEFLGTLTAVKTAGYTAAVGDVVPCDASGGGFTVYLPSAPTAGSQVTVKKIDESANAVLVQRTGSDVFNHEDGPSVLQLGIPSQSVVLRYKSGVWLVVSNSVAPTSLDDRYAPLNTQVIRDANGDDALTIKFLTDDFFTPLDGKANYFEIDRFLVTGPNLRAQGPGADVGLLLTPKGLNGAVYVNTRTTGGTARLWTGSLDTNTNLDIRSKGTGLVLINGQPCATTAGAQTFSDKRFWRRISSTATTGSLTPQASVADIYVITALSQALTMNAPTGTIANGEQLEFRIKDNGTGRAITWNAAYRPVGVTLPTTTTADKILYVRAIYNTPETIWDVVDVGVQDQPVENTANKGQANGYASLDGSGKIPVAQLPNSIMEYQGVWNASTNTPTLANGTGNAGDVYRVSVGGTQLGLTFDAGDYAIYNGSTWEKSDATDAVTSVAGKTGAVTLVKGDVGLGNVDNVQQQPLRTIQSITSAVTIATTGGDQFVIINTGGLPTLGTAVGSTCQVKLRNNTNAGVLIATTSSQTIDGIGPSPGYTLQAGHAITLVPNNGNWSVF